MSISLNSFLDNVSRHNPKMFWFTVYKLPNNVERLDIVRMLRSDNPEIGVTIECSKITICSDESYISFHQRFWDIVFGPCKRISTTE